jgi:enoyl-CoA hydratase/carnithine racemase
MSEKGDRIQFAREGAVAFITLTCPEEQNRLDPDAAARLGQIVDELAADQAVHAVVLSGAGGEWFSAGFLNPEIRAAMSKDEVVEFVMFANRVLDALEALPQITICAINGQIMAGAVEISLACDIRLAAEQATLTMPEARWGGFPGAGGPVRLPMVVGYARALELICTARQIDAAEMLRIGLVEQVHAGDQVIDAARAMAAAAAANGPLATRGAKQIAQARRSEGFEAARQLSDKLRRDLEWSQDVDEGMAAHKENRDPNFLGR